MGLPIKPFDPGAPSVVADNDARWFHPFDPAALNWLPGDTEDESVQSRRAMGLGLRLTAAAGQSPTVVPVAFGLMTCQRAPGMPLILSLEVGGPGLTRLRAGDLAAGLPPLLVDAVRFRYAFDPALEGRLRARLVAHLGAGNLEPMFAEGAYLRRLEQGGLGGVAPGDNQFQLGEWLAGNSAILWRFTGLVVEEDADLVQLAAGESVTLFAEVRGAEPGGDETDWYRVNPGFLLNRLARTGEEKEAYLRVSGGTVRPVASGVFESVEHGQERVVAGGSYGSVVLQPAGLVPSSLFSYVTFDEITVFSGAQDAELWVERRSPTLRRDRLEEFWRSNRYAREDFVAGAPQEFVATDLAAQLKPQKKKEEKKFLARDQAWYDMLAGIIGYNRALTLPPGLGALGDLFTTPGPLWTFVPQARIIRPDHPGWLPVSDSAPDHAVQLRRLYPMRLSFLAGPDLAQATEFTVTQDATDCARQEYALHMNWRRVNNRYYYQNALAASGKLVPANDDVPGADAQGRTVPAIPTTAGQRIVIPPRTDFRYLLQDAPERDPENVALENLPRYLPIFMMRPELIADRLTELRQLMEPQLTEMERIIAGTVAPDASALSPWLRSLMAELILAVLPAAAQKVTTPRGFLHRLYAPGQPAPSLDIVATFTRRMAAIRQQGVIQPKLILKASSLWRPPEHNETASSVITSNHQPGWALDIQPSQTSGGARNPLFIAALHDLAVRNYSPAGNSPLSEALLESQRDSFLSGNPDYLLREVAILRATRHGKIVYEYVPASGGPVSPVSLPDEALPDLKGPGVPSQFAANTFNEYFDKIVQASGAWPNPAPTAMQIYLFALFEASHVHFTFRAGRPLA
ncbi:hypothetical protein ACWDRB_60810 [Nonomuraea sp. NPDC003707]